MLVHSSHQYAWKIYSNYYFTGQILCSTLWLRLRQISDDLLFQAITYRTLSFIYDLIRDKVYISGWIAICVLRLVLSALLCWCLACRIHPPWIPWNIWPKCYRLCAQGNVLLKGFAVFCAVYLWPVWLCFNEVGKSLDGNFVIESEADRA